MTHRNRFGIVLFVFGHLVYIAKPLIIVLPKLAVVFRYKKNVKSSFFLFVTCSTIICSESLCVTMWSRLLIFTFHCMVLSCTLTKLTPSRPLQCLYFTVFNTAFCNNEAELYAEINTIILQDRQHTNLIKDGINVCVTLTLVKVKTYFKL